MGEVRFMISEAAKKVHVESHVLRYWEEELGLSIGRTEMGHRYYTEDDIQLFCCIKRLKDEGMLLRDLKLLIPQLNETRNRLRQADKVSEKTTAKSAVKALAGAATKTDIKTVADAAAKPLLPERILFPHRTLLKNLQPPCHRLPLPLMKSLPGRNWNR